MYINCMSLKVTTGNIAATSDCTTVSYDTRDVKIAALELRISLLEDDFIKLTAFVNSIASK